MSERARVVVLISGRGSNMRALAERAQATDSPYTLGAVVSDQAGAGGLEWARSAGIGTALVSALPGEGRAAYGARLATAVNAHGPDLVALAGFMRILSQGFVHHYAGRMLNIHPSLLPKYPGLHTHKRALEAGEREHGATVHFVTEKLDGGPRVIQGCIPIDAEDTEDTLAARLLTVEHQIYPLAVSWFAQGRLAVRDGLATLDGQPLAEPVQLR